MDNFEEPEIEMTDRELIIQLQHSQSQLIDQLNRFVSQPLPHAPPPPPPPPSPLVIPLPPNLNLPSPPSFSGLAKDLPEFRMKMTQFINGNPHIYTTSRTQLLYAGHSLTGPASQWYRAHVDPATQELPPSYDLASFFVALEDFFGGAVTLQSRERALRSLRQTGSVSELAIAFQTIVHTFSPLWADHPLIYTFSDKLKENIRFELTARGSLPTTFQAYLTAAIAVEQNQEAAALSRSQPPPQSRSPFIPKPLPPNNPPPRPAAPLPSGPTPMDLDGSRGPRGALNPEERRRRAEGGLCAYCGGTDHSLATCPRAAHARQARGTFLPLPHFPAPLAGYPYPSPGYPTPQGPFPGPWNLLPNPYAAAAAASAAAAADQPKNSHPSQ